MKTCASRCALILLAALAVAACRNEARERGETAATEAERDRVAAEEAERTRRQAELMSSAKESLASLSNSATPAAVEEVCEPLLFANVFEADLGVAERCSMAYVKLAEAHLRKGELAKAGVYIDRHRFTGVISEKADTTAAKVAAARAQERARAAASSGSQGSSSKAASPTDWRQAQDFLAKLPDACSSSRASVSPDGSVLITLKCMGERPMAGQVRIKDGLVTEIR